MAAAILGQENIKIDLYSSKEKKSNQRKIIEPLQFQKITIILLNKFIYNLLNFFGHPKK